MHSTLRSPLSALTFLGALIWPTPLGPLVYAQGLPRHNPMLHQDGIRIVDEHGTEVHLRGVNLGGWLVWEGWIFGNGILTSQATMTARLEKAVGPQQTESFRNQVYDHFITEADIQRIAQAGFHCVRVPLHCQLFDTDQGWTLLDRVVGWCERQRIYVLLDLHTVPGSSLGRLEPNPVWKSEESRKKIVGLGRAIAARYRNRKIIAGYDLINEPLPPSGEALVSLYQRIIGAIRQVDADHLIILEGSKFATDFSMFDKPLDENLVYSFHMYTWFGDDRRKKLAEYQSLARKQNTPLWVGEFGQNTYAMIRSTVQMYAQCPEINGWAFWTWKKAPGPYAGGTYPGLVTIKVPRDWQTTMGWLGGLFDGQQPKPAIIKNGMKEFIEAMELRNCDYDQRMEQILLLKAE